MSGRASGMAFEDTILMLKSVYDSSTSHSFLCYHYLLILGGFRSMLVFEILPTSLLYLS